MNTAIKLFSNKEEELYHFLNLFYSHDKVKDVKTNTLEWQIQYENPIEVADMIGCLIENNDKFQIAIWMSMDQDVYLNVTEENADEIIRYLFERFPY